MSEVIYDKEAGMNGSFEFTKAGMPVNWLIYSPKTIPSGEYDLIIDTIQVREGQKSLMFKVKECSDKGGWYSPGFCNEYKARPGEIFRISFFTLNQGAEYIIRVGGISATTGKYDNIVRTKESSDTWRQFEYYYTIPEEMNAIRFEMNILQPGEFRIDDGDQVIALRVKIVKHL